MVTISRVFKPDGEVRFYALREDEDTPPSEHGMACEHGRACAPRTPPSERGVCALSGEDLLAIMREVCWYKDAPHLQLDPDDDTACQLSDANLLMFLSDVRTRRFKRGIFLDDGVLRLAEHFRQAAGVVAQGLYVPDLTCERGVFRARWRAAVGIDKVHTCELNFYLRCIDSLARRAQRTALEEDTGHHYTLHDAWFAALRSDTGDIRWEAPEEEFRAFQRELARWYAPLAMSADDRAAMCFTLVPPPDVEGPWRVTLARAPTTHAGLVSLGQAAQIFPPLAGIRRTPPSSERGRACAPRTPSSSERGASVAGEVEFSTAEAENFLRAGAQALTAAGFTVETPDGLTGEHITAEADLTPVGRNIEATPALPASASVTSKLVIRVDGEVVTERELQFLVDQNSALVFFRDRWIEVDRWKLREALRAVQSVKGKKLKLAEAVSFALGTGRVGHLRVAAVAAHGWLRGLLNELRGDDCFRVLPPPEGLAATLRDYQLRGVSWLAFLVKWGFGPCLADDMGLGKTIQTIAWMLQFRAAHPHGGAILVVAPVSVVTNWQRECAKFAPGLRVMVHQGATRATGAFFTRRCAQVDVVLTGYSLLARDFADFSAAAFSALVLDEAQMVKNPDTRAAKAARALEIPVKVALTGTPFENSATDLWSLEELLNPGLLGERKDFEETYTRTIRADARGGAAAKLKHILEPFMLRRLKTDPGVAAELGAKREVREYCPLSAAQRRRYEEALFAFRQDAEADGSLNRGRALALLTELKLICDGDGKLARLDELLEMIFANGESCLIFTQYAKVGHLLQAHLRETFGTTYPFLHGGLSPAAREGEIAAFNASPEPNAFILSLRAGGFGLNLTRATHVIHFDRWWNPAVENQATDRAHRIGQTQTVFVHLFICAGTLEDHIDELLETKRYLADEVITGGESFLLKMDAAAFARTVSLGNA